MCSLHSYKLYTSVVCGVLGSGKWVKGQSIGNPLHLGTTGRGRGNVHTHNFINIIAYNQNIQSYTTVTMSNIIALMYIII